jgi:hypothetical protein
LGRDRREVYPDEEYDILDEENDPSDEGDHIPEDSVWG